MSTEQNVPPLEQFKLGGATPLAFEPPWPDPVHQFDRREAIAIQAALLSGRPLLIEGPPGSGKTQIAAAAAAVLQRELIVFVVNSDTRPEDLLWRYDALQRLNDAQAHCLKETREYLAKGALWLALEEDGDNDKHAAIRPALSTYRPKELARKGKVLLIDEIDKADRSVPNSLLEVFGHRRFRCPHLDEEDSEILAGQEAPLVIITSNREQELPPAFVRRCLVLRLRLPETEDEFVATLAKRAEMHFGDCCNPDQYREIARALWEYRQRSGLAPDRQPGQAEYFDLVRAIGGALEAQLTDASGATIGFDDLLREMQGLAFDKSGRGGPAAETSDESGGP